MILIIGGRSSRYLVSPSGRHKARSNFYAGKPDLKMEITRLDLEIASLSGKTQTLSRKLGELYARFLCEDRRNPSTEKTQAHMLALSREADNCIEKLYMLEKKRSVMLETANA